jgi:hypothetical protein
MHPGMVTVEGGEHLGHPDASGVLEQELDIQSTKRLKVPKAKVSRWTVQAVM